MKVNFAFVFDEAQLRKVRAAHGRGGVASRNECRIFMHRAILSALEDAPTPKPKRVRRAKPEPAPRRVETPDEELARTRQQVAKIKGMYRTATDGGAA